MELKIFLDGQWISTDADSIKQMALEGKIRRDTLIHYGDRVYHAEKVKGIVFPSADNNAIPEIIEVQIGGEWISISRNSIAESIAQETITPSSVVRINGKEMFIAKFRE